MPRYHIHTQPAPAPFDYPAKFQMDETDAYVKYGHRVFSGTSQRGDRYWTAEILTQTWFQAETGRIPISGAGYGGPFSGEGFEGMWLDMSEIVRPTRDGIHGRESISTVVSIGGAPEMLEFDAAGQLLTPLPSTMNLPIPVVFGPLPLPLPGEGAVRALALAAGRLGTLFIRSSDALAVAPNHSLALRLGAADFNASAGLPQEPVYVEIEDEAWAIERWRAARERWPNAMVAMRHALGPNSPSEVERLLRQGVRIFHLYADDEGRDQAGRPLPDSLRAVHTHLVQRRWRDSLSFLVSGGIAAAEHLPKIIACGADVVVLDWVPIIAWGCSLWADKGTCPVENRELDAEWGAQRLVNLMAAWRDQLLEALGAMGIREVRRLRPRPGWQTGISPGRLRRRLRPPGVCIRAERRLAAGRPGRLA